jgi:hypothetical protein
VQVGNKWCDGFNRDNFKLKLYQPTTFGTTPFPIVHSVILRKGYIHKDVILSTCERKCEQMSQANIFKNILLTSIEYYLTHGMKYLVMWRNIMPRVMDEQYFWMKMDEK